MKISVKTPFVDFHTDRAFKRFKQRSLDSVPLLSLPRIWGDLEEYVLKQAEGKFGNAPEKYSIFAGPVFDEDDEWFEGFDDRGRVRVQIPRKFWKIVIAEASGSLQAFAFLLEQNLQAVVFEEEFQVSEEWSEHLVGVEELQAMLEGIEFSQKIVNADQSDSDGGEELMRLSKIERLK